MRATTTHTLQAERGSNCQSAVVITNDGKDIVHTGGGGKYVRFQMRLQNEGRENVRSGGRRRPPCQVALRLQNEGRDDLQSRGGEGHMLDCS